MPKQRPPQWFVQFQGALYFDTKHNPLCFWLLPACCFHVNCNLWSCDSQGEERFTQQSRCLSRCRSEARDTVEKFMILNKSIFTPKAPLKSWKCCCNITLRVSWWSFDWDVDRIWRFTLFLWNWKANMDDFLQIAPSSMCYYLLWQRPGQWGGSFAVTCNLLLLLFRQTKLLLSSPDNCRVAPCSIQGFPVISSDDESMLIPLSSHPCLMYHPACSPHLLSSC